jgi:hypothetical protein
MAVLFLLWLVIQGPADTGGVGLCSWLLPNDPLLWFIGLSRILPPSSPLEFRYIGGPGVGSRGRQPFTNVYT